MFRPLALALLLLLPLQAGAEACHGRNLIAALAADDLALIKARAEVPFAHGNLWTATKDGQTITLAGTYHLSDPRFAKSMEQLGPVLAQASVLLVEAGPQEEAALKEKVSRQPDLMLTKGQTLPEQLSDADWQALSAALRARGMPPVMAARMQPWLVASMLTLPACLFPMTPEGETGLDKLLIAKAAAAGLPVQPLEPFDTILGMFAQFPAADQMRMLMQTVATDAQSDDMAVTLADSYFAGESALFWEFTRLQMLNIPGATAEEVDHDLDLVQRAMVTGRNATWIPVLEAAARQGPVLAAFGALHLSGDKGVLNLMAQRGWKIAPLAP